MHILAAILAAAGKILLAIVILIVLIVLLVLFVPVRYRIQGRADESITGNAKITWFFSVIKADINIPGRDGLFSVIVKAAGHELFRIGDEEKNKAENKNKSSGKSSKSDIIITDEKNSEEDSGSEKSEEPVKSADLLETTESENDRGSVVNAGPENSRESVEVTESENDRGSVVNAESENRRESVEIAESENNRGSVENEEPENSRESVEVTESENNKESAESGKSENTESEIASGTDDNSDKVNEEKGGYTHALKRSESYNKINKDSEKEKPQREIFKRIKSKISGIIHALKSRKEKIVSEIRGIARKSGSLKEKLRLIRRFYESEAFREFIPFIKKKLLKLIKHCLPRKIESDITFGMDDPSETGLILGGIYALTGAVGIRLYITPDFNEKILKGYLKCRGRVYLFYAGALGLSILTSHRFRDFKKKFEHFKTRFSKA